MLTLFFHKKIDLYFHRLLTKLIKISYNNIIKHLTKRNNRVLKIFWKRGIFLSDKLILKEFFEGIVSPFHLVSIEVETLDELYLELDIKNQKGFFIMFKDLFEESFDESGKLKNSLILEDYKMPNSLIHKIGVQIRKIGFDLKMKKNYWVVVKK